MTFPPVVGVVTGSLIVRLFPVYFLLQVRGRWPEAVLGNLKAIYSGAVTTPTTGKNPYFYFMEATDKQIESLLTKVFQSPEETIKLLAPNGWENSPYVHYMHPTTEQIYTEQLRLYEAHKGSKWFKTEMPIFDNIVNEYEVTQVRPLFEFLDFFGTCLWKIFSDNHTVFDEDGVEYDLGSFRGTGSTLSDFINENHWTDEQFDYLDFYCAMGLKDWLPVQNMYELIFTRLKDAGCDWRYSHPHIQLISFGREDTDIKLEEYDPTQNLLKEMENEKREQEIKDFQSKLDEIAEEEKQQSFNDLPGTVLAYQTIYGKLPDGFL
ncbi:MAG: hypothetical protein ACHQIM_20135 [Sphingobacteriales bacterium]